MNVCRWVDFREEVLKLENGREVLFSGRVDNNGVPWITDSIKSVVEVWSWLQLSMTGSYHDHLLNNVNH